jgi:hypothetical protein
VGYHKAFGLATSFASLIADRPKRKRPAGERAFSIRCDRLTRRVAGNSWNIASRYAEVGKIAI